ncbi:hypothetical protein CKO15_11445 [Halorhodospira abdelmalekii]|uniref:hypothetical protein n=1 Tax=Halorhodospira abdelmalekii TaxID=421629 RepID=UPI0019058553|nr:hypothetical protein [Halorhodospira abdelmalekii]MBK1735881.1 hypothetical protein [Halorhodospira abdelmalekii]
MTTEEGRGAEGKSGAKSGGGSKPDAREIRERLVWRAAVVMLLATTGWLFYVAFDAQERAEELTAELEQLQAAVETAEEEGATTVTAPGLSEAAAERFAAAGIEQTPEGYLLARLDEEGAWLSEALELEGPVRVRKAESLVLSDQWLYAQLETEQGEQYAALLSYRLAEDGQLTWEVVARSEAE